MFDINPHFTWANLPDPERPVTHKSTHRVGTLIVKRYADTFCKPWMMISVIELQQFYLLSFTRSAELVRQMRFRTLTFHTRSGRHGASITASLAGQDTYPIIVPFQLTPWQHSFSEMENMPVVIASLLDLYQKKCQTVEGYH